MTRQPARDPDIVVGIRRMRPAKDSHTGHLIKPKQRLTWFARWASRAVG